MQVILQFLLVGTEVGGDGADGHLSLVLASLFHLGVEVDGLWVNFGKTLIESHYEPLTLFGFQFGVVEALLHGVFHQVDILLDGDSESLRRDGTNLNIFTFHLLCESGAKSQQQSRQEDKFLHHDIGF